MGGIVVAFGLLLAMGPISLGFLNGSLEEILSDKDGRFTVQIETTSIAWAGWERNIDLRASGIHVKDPSGNVIVDLPNIAISLSGRAMLNRVLAVSSVDLFGLSLTARRLADGTLTMGLANADEGDRNLKPLVEYLSVLEGAPSANNPLTYLERIRIIDADLAFVDVASGRQGRAPKAGLVLRREGGQLRVGLRADFHVEGRIFQTATVVRHDQASRLFRFASNLRVDDTAFFLGLLSPALGNAPAAQQQPRSKPGAARHRVTGTIQGSFDPDKNLFNLSEVAFKTRGSVPIDIPLSPNWALPVQELSGSASYDLTNAKATVENLHLDLGGPNAYLTAEVLGIGGQPVLTGHMALTNVNFEQVRRGWPDFLAPKTRAWIFKHVLAGTVPKLQLNFKVSLGGPKPRLDTLQGEFEVTDGELDYVEGLPVLRNGTAKATFNRSRLDIHVTGGRSAEGVVLRGGTVTISNIVKKPARLSIKLDLESPLGAGIGAISKPPLHLTKDFEINPGDLEGDLAVGLELGLTIGDKQWRKNLAYEVRARTTDAAWSRPTWPRRLTNGNLVMKADNKTVEVNGHFRVNSVPVDFTWQRQRTKENVWKSRVVAKGEVTPSNLVKDLELKTPLFGPPFLDGPMGVTVAHETTTGKSAPVTVNVDLHDSTIWFPMIDWSKPNGVPAAVKVDFTRGKDKVMRIPSFSFSSKGLKLAGKLDFAKDGKTVSVVDISNLSQGRNMLAIRASRTSGNAWQVNLKGKSLDLRPLRRSLSSGGEGSMMPPIAANLDMGTVWFRLGHGLRNVSGQLYFDGANWQNIALSGTLKSGQPASLAINPSGAGQRVLQIQSEDAGAALRAFDIYDNMVGGKLRLRGIYDDAAPQSVLKGRLRINRFRVVKAPVLAKLLSVASLTGILESLSGSGLAFEGVDAPFVARGSEIQLLDGQAYGASIGITASGVVDKGRDRVDIHGTIAPAYLINQIPGKIPLIGEIFSGGEKGSGVFAANYKITGSLKQPDILVNPLSALAPGFLRNLFKIDSP